MELRRALALCAGLLFLGNAAESQGSACPNDWIETFGAAPGPDGSVKAFVEFDDGSGPALYVGGEFPSIGGVFSRSIARWDGQRWSALESGLGTGFDGGVSALAVHDDGSGPALYAGGSFVRTGTGVTVNRIARWNGSTWTPVLEGFNGPVNALVSFDAGAGPRLYAGGAFLQAGPRIRERMAAWDGSAWLPVDALDSIVWTLAIHDDGNGPALHAGGDFTLAIGVGGSYPLQRVARLQGVTWVPLGAGFDRVVQTLHSHGGRLHAGGAFTRSGTQARAGLSSWDGSTWLSAGTPTGTGVRSIATADDGSGPALYILGRNSVHFLARDSGTHTIAEFDGPSPNVVGSFHDGTGSQVLVGGSFSLVEDTPVLNIARLQAGVWQGLGKGVIGLVSALAEYGGGAQRELIVGGSFTAAGGVPLASIARWKDGVWQPLGSGLTLAGGSSGVALALAEHDDGHGPELFVAGSFAAADGLAVRNVAAWNGQGFRGVGGGTDGASQTVHELCVFDDGGGPQLYAGGLFTMAGGAAVNVARWNGSSWLPLGAGLAGRVADLASYDSGSGPELYAAGDASNPSPGLFRWTGATWLPIAGAPSSVVALAVHDDGNGSALFLADDLGRLWRWDGLTLSLASGQFTTYGAFASLLSLDLGDGRALYASGFLRASQQEIPQGVQRWKDGQWSLLGAGIHASVGPLYAFHDGARLNLLAGGDFAGTLPPGDSTLALFGPGDRSAPTIDAPARVNRLDAPGSPPGEFVTFEVSALDAHDPAPLVQVSPPSGSFFARGVTTVTVTATDACGNSAQASFEVHVEPKVRRR